MDMGTLRSVAMTHYGRNRKNLVSMVMIFFVVLGFVPLGESIKIDQSYAGVNHISEENIDLHSVINVEFWGLIVGVGVYLNHHDKDLPWVLNKVDNLYDVLLQSTCWSADHVKVLKGEQATAVNMLLGSRWLSRMVDDNDICLIYIATHGLTLPFDIPPFDEVLATYKSFEQPLTVIWDDQLNFLLDKIDSRGMCLIVDSCHSGGFNDSVFYGRKRVVLMSCRENEESYGPFFTHYLIEGLDGKADFNKDNICSAEEIFAYASSRMPGNKPQHPVILDEYSDDLPLLLIE